MKLKGFLRYAAAGALCLLLCAAGLGQTAFAVEAKRPIQNFDPSKACSLTLEYAHPGISVTVYPVAKMESNGRFTMNEKLVLNVPGQNLDPNRQTSASGWRDLALALNYKIKELSGKGETLFSTTKTTGRDKRVTFSGSGMTPGLYLVVTKPFTYKERDAKTGLLADKVYEVSPYLVSLPTWDGTLNGGKGDWSYAVMGNVAKKATVTERGTVNIQAVKLWKNSSGQTVTDHPSSVTVALMDEQGKISQVQTLPTKYGWTCHWTGLDNTKKWTVVELDVSGDWIPYVFQAWGSDNQFVLTNYLSDPPDEIKPSQPVNSQPVNSQPVNSQPPVTNPPVNSRPPVNSPPPTPNDPDVPIDDPDIPLGPPPIDAVDEPPEEIEIDEPEIPLGDLPQTGQLWWPVPFLAMAGMFLVLLGLIRRRGGEYYEE